MFFARNRIKTSKKVPIMALSDDPWKYNVKKELLSVANSRRCQTAFGVMPLVSMAAVGTDGNFTSGVIRCRWSLAWFSWW